jgi:hypothetical protein
LTGNLLTPRKFNCCYVILAEFLDRSIIFKDMFIASDVHIIDDMGYLNLEIISSERLVKSLKCTGI